MARGTLYGISCNREDAECFSPVDVYDHAGHDFDYINDGDSPECVVSLVERLESLGAEIGKEEGVYFIIIDEETKRHYFVERLIAFKKRAAEISLDEFALDDPYDLRWMVDNTNSDAAYSYDYGFCTMDQWIRSAAINEKYYLAHAYCMH